MSYRTLPLTFAAEASQSFDLGLISIVIVPRYNYQMSCWAIDILDANDNLLAGGLVAVPYVDILGGLPELKLRIGALVFVENNTGDYLIAESLGYNLQLFWYPPSEAVELFTPNPATGP